MEEESKKQVEENYFFADEDKSVIPVTEEKASAAAGSLAIIQEIADPAANKVTRNLIERAVMFAEIETEKRLALIKAWEESEKTKVENRAYKGMSAVGLWEENKKTSVEAQLKKIEEKFERKKAEYTEKMKNKVAEIHRIGEEKRALIEAKQREESLKVEETASKYHDSGSRPRRLLGCFICANYVL